MPQALNEGALLLQDTAKHAREILEHLRDEAARWAKFRDEQLDVTDTRISRSHPRAFQVTGIGVGFVQQVCFENPRRKGFTIQNWGAQVANLKLGDGGIFDANDISFQMPALGASTSANLLSCPIDVPLYTGNIWLYFSAGAAGDKGILFTEFF